MNFLSKILLFSLFCSQSFAGPFFEVQDLYIDAHKYTGRANTPIQDTIGRKLDNGLNLGLNIDVWNFAYFNNLIDSRTACTPIGDCQFAEVSWNFQVGFRITKYLDLRYAHRSAHALDSNYEYNVEDSIGIRLHLINSDNYKESIFR